MQEMYLHVHTPLRDALRAGHATHGFERIELTDQDVRSVPDVLRDELAIWVELAARDDNPHEFDSRCCLRLEAPDVGMPNVVRALQREAKARRAAMAATWLAKRDEEWIDSTPFDRCIHVEVAGLADFPDVDRRLERVRKKLEEMERADSAQYEASERAQKGLTIYAQHVPQYARAAKEGYDVAVAALDHFVHAIAAFDADATVLTKSSEEFKRAKLDERKAPNQHAFDVLDAVTAHIKKLPSPDGVDVNVGRIQRYRRGVVRDRKWVLDVPVTVVIVTCTAYIADDRVVLFFADAEEKKKNYADLTDDIPF